MAEDPNPQDPPDWKAIAALMANGLLTEGVPGFLKAWQAAHVETHGAVRALDMNLGVDMIAFIADRWRGTEEALMPLIGALVAPIVAGLFGSETGAADYSRRMAAGEGSQVARAIVDGFLAAIAGDTAAPIVPSVEGAHRIASAAVQATLESQLNALIPEIASDFLPLEFGKVTALMELPEGIIRTLGVSRLVRRALSPLVDATCATPAKWHYGRLYRQTLLGASTLAKQIARHPDKRETWLEDLRREGYSDERIEALLNEQAKFHSIPDLDMLMRAGQWSQSEAVQHLRDQGYEDDVARTELLIEQLKRIASFERSMANAAVDAYVAGRIDEGTLGGFITGATISAQEKAQFAELASARRICARRPLSSAEVSDLVQDGILAYVDYRRALEREGRDDDAVINLELRLRKKIDDKKEIAQHRAELEKDRAAEKAARLADAAAKKAAADAKLALARRGSMADLEAAYVRGLIPIGRVREVYDATYDGDTVDTLAALLETRRADYVAQLAAAAAAKARAATRGVDVGALEKAVTTGVLTLDEFRTRLAQLGFADDDAGLLTATLAAQLQQRADDDAKHDAAAAAAKVKHVDLSTLELLVRRGHRTLDDYRAALAGLGYDDGSQAALVERLQLQIDDDAAAAKVREDAAAKLRNKGLSLEQFRRAVLLGIKPISDFTPFLLANGFGADAVSTLVAVLQADLDEADAARERRQRADSVSQAGRAPLADVRRAARLGLIQIGAYTDRLAGAGWSADDIDLEVDLLTQEIAEAQAARAQRAAADAASRDKGVPLATLARLVRAGVQTVDAYQAAARAAGYSDDAAAQMAMLLEQELAADQAAAARRKAIAAAAAVKHVSLGQIEAAVLDGARTLDDYADAVRALGYEDDDVQTLVALLQDRVDRQAAGEARQTTLDGTDGTKALARADFAKGVLAGLRTLDDYGAWLSAQGYADDDVQLLVDLVAIQLQKAADKAAGA